MPQQAAKPREVTFAVAFLRRLHANSNNVYLILSVVAWLRSESGQNWIGNNPLNIRKSKYAIGYRQTRGNGKFAIFANASTAAMASADLLLSPIGKWAGYDAMVRAVRRGTKDVKDQQRQAIDFLQALILSKWDAGHYGLNAKERKDPNAIYTTVIYKVWAGLLGQKVTIPVAAQDKPKPPKPPPPAPRQPRSLRHILVEREYIEPYAATEFYESRLRTPPTLPGSTPDDSMVR